MPKISGNMPLTALTETKTNNASPYQRGVCYARASLVKIHRSTPMRSCAMDLRRAMVAQHGGVEHWQVENTSVGWRRLAVGLSQAGVTRVGIEASLWARL